MSDPLPVLIRAAEPADIDQLTALMNLPGYRHGTLRLPYESVDAARKRLFSGNADVTPLVADLDGRMLLEAAIGMADDWLGLLRLELSVNVDNAPAIRLYESVGFEREGCERRSIFRAGQYVDALTMARLRELPMQM